MVSSISNPPSASPYKPRSAKIDRWVIELFDKLNGLPSREKSIDIDLPVYKILNITWQGKEVSVWELIEGSHCQDVTVDSFLSTMPKTQARDSLLQQLLRLESILHPLGISDLHPQNVLITPATTTHQSTIVPIDLESIQEDSSTGLYRTPPTTPSLKSSERQLVDLAKKDLSTTPYRYITNPTSSFLGCIGNCFYYDRPIDQAFEQIHRNGFQLQISKDKLAELVLEDVINNDVSYFVYHEGQILSGHTKTLLAKR